MACAEDLPPSAYLARMSDFAHLQEIDREAGKRVRDYLIPLGAIEKVRGVWAPRDRERHSGNLESVTWRVLDGYTSEEMVEELDDRLAKHDAASIRFSCEARGCGSSVQWANKIFGERLLYGTEASQRYRVYALEHGGESYRILIYGSARSSDRQYLHAEALTIAP
ncbi:DUF4892 domain-containing protein [Congregibacter sp.]|uniref:DUF4892 domain-containing protein n=1 Tax=Congregibacter sp. TaxID=2744308 RepID=UPI003F6D9F80